MQRLLGDWKELFKKLLYTYFSNRMAICWLFDEIVYQIQKLTPSPEGLSLSLQKRPMVEVDIPLKKEEGVNTAASNHSANTDDALRYVGHLKA